MYFSNARVGEDRARFFYQIAWAQGRRRMGVKGGLKRTFRQGCARRQG